MWQRLLGAPPRNRVKCCSKEAHFDSERVSACPPPSCSPDWFRVAAISISSAVPTLRSLPGERNVQVSDAASKALVTASPQPSRIWSPSTSQLFQSMSDARRADSRSFVVLGKSASSISFKRSAIWLRAKCVWISRILEELEENRLKSHIETPLASNAISAIGRIGSGNGIR